MGAISEELRVVNRRPIHVLVSFVRFLSLKCTSAPWVCISERIVGLMAPQRTRLMPLLPAPTSS